MNKLSGRLCYTSPLIAGIINDVRGKSTGHQKWSLRTLKELATIIRIMYCNKQYEHQLIWFMTCGWISFIFWSYRLLITCICNYFFFFILIEFILICNSFRIFIFNILTIITRCIILTIIGLFRNKILEDIHQNMLNIIFN